MGGGKRVGGRRDCSACVLWSGVLVLMAMCAVRTGLLQLARAAKLSGGGVGRD